jgi:hypothetical protein
MVNTLYGADFFWETYFDWGMEIVASKTATGSWLRD